MPACFKCQTPYEEGQRFCKGCGSDLRSTVAPQIVCPGCGVPIPDQAQAFCHECGARLDVAPEPVKPDTPSALPPPPRRTGFIDKVVKGSPMQIFALVGGCLVVLAVILMGISWLTGRTSSGPADTLSRSKAPGQAARPAPVASAAPEVLGPPFFSKPTKMAEFPKATVAVDPAVHEPALSLKEELEETLFNMRKGQEEKDINLFMSCFSPSFPDLDKKRQETLKRWVVFDFSQLVFNIDDVQEEGADSHIALVTWDVQARDRNNQKTTTSSQQFKVRFIKEQGRQLIKSLEKEGKEGVS